MWLLKTIHFRDVPTIADPWTIFKRNVLLSKRLSLKETERIPFYEPRPCLGLAGFLILIKIPPHPEDTLSAGLFAAHAPFRKDLQHRQIVAEKIG